VLDALGGLADEVVLLAVQTGRTLRRLAAPALGLMLLGWSANELSILLATEVSATWPWLVVVVLAVGVVLQLATILALLRLAAVHLGIPGMLKRAAIGTEVDDTRDTSVLHLMTTTLLPFLGMYAAFGFASGYASRLVKLASVRKGFGDLPGALDPFADGRLMATTIAVLVAGWLFKKLVDPWLDRTRYPLLVGALQVLVEAVLLFVGLLVAFRIFDEISLWLSSRVYDAWLEQAMAWVSGLVRVDVPEVLTAGWSFFSGTLWPLLFGGLTRPLLWLAMAGLVFGSRVLSLADLWSVGQPATQVRTRRERMLARLHADTEVATGVRLIALKGQEFLLGGIDGTIIPAWQSLRLVLRAGWPFLGAFVIAFTVVDLAGTVAQIAVFRLVGGHEVGFWLRLLPLVDMIELVLQMTVIWILLAVAYTRALSIFAGRTPDDVEPVLVTGNPKLRDTVRSGATVALTVTVATSLFVVAAGAVHGRLELGHETNRVALGEPGDLQGARVLAAEPRLARSLTFGRDTVTTQGVFVVLTVLVSSPGPSGATVFATLRSGERSYRSWPGFGPPTAPAGFVVGRDIVFEVDPADLGPETVVELEPMEPVQSYQEWVQVPLGLGADAAATASSAVEVDTTGSRAAT
jgi:hypothetical protein